MDFDDAAPDTVLDDCDFLLQLAEEAADDKYGAVVQPRAPNPTTQITPGAGYQALGQVGSVTSVGGLFGAQPPRPAVDQGGYTEKLSGLRVSRPVIGSLVVRERLSDGTFVKFSSLTRSEDVPASTWNTLVVLASKVQGQSQRGDPYSRWTVTDLSGTSATLFVFGAAQRDHYKESEGSVLILAHPKWKREEPRGGGAPFSLSVERPEQIVRAGVSPDFGFCLGKRSDGSGCKQVVNRSQCEYCVYHAPAALKKLTAAARPDLQGRSLFERTLRPVAHKGEQLRAQQRALVVKPVLTGQQIREAVARATSRGGSGQPGGSGPTTAATAAATAGGGEGASGGGALLKRSRGADLVLASASAQDELEAKKRRKAAAARRGGRGRASTGFLEEEDEEEDEENRDPGAPVSEAKARLMAAYKAQQQQGQGQGQSRQATPPAAANPRAASAPPARPPTRVTSGAALAMGAGTQNTAGQGAAPATVRGAVTGPAAGGRPAAAQLPVPAAAETAAVTDQGPHASQEDEDLEIEDVALPAATATAGQAAAGAVTATAAEDVTVQGAGASSSQQHGGPQAGGGLSQQDGEDDLEIEGMPDGGAGAGDGEGGRSGAANNAAAGNSSGAPKQQEDTQPAKHSGAAGTRVFIGAGHQKSAKPTPSQQQAPGCKGNKENSGGAQGSQQPRPGPPLPGSSGLAFSKGSMQQRQAPLQQGAGRQQHGATRNSAPQTAAGKLMAELGIKRQALAPCSHNHQHASQQQASKRKAQDMLASLGVGRGSGGSAGGMGQHAQGASRSAMAAAFGGVLASAPEAAEAEGSRYSALAEDASFQDVLKNMDALEKREALVAKMEATTKLQVTAFHCKECDYFSERKQPQCAEHTVRKVSAVKRWWRCNHCNGHFDTIGVLIPKKRCPRCNDPGQEFTPASMYRGPKGGMKVAGTGPGEGGPNLAERQAFLPRGTEHAFSMRGGSA